MNSRRASSWWWVLMVIPIALGLLRLRFDVDVLNLLPSHLPDIKGLQAWQKYFDGSNDLLITLKGNDAAVLAAQAESLAAVLREEPGLTGSVYWRPPWEEHPGQAAELTAAMWMNQSPAAVKSLEQRLAPEALAGHLEELKQQLAVSFSPDELARLSYDPLGLLDVPNAGEQGFLEVANEGAPFSSPEGTFRVLFVKPGSSLNNYQEAMAWLERIQSLLAAWQSSLSDAASPVVKLTGGPMFNSEISQSMERDMKRSVIGTSVVVSLLFLLVHRRIRPLLWLLMLLGLVLLATMGLGGLMLGTLNVVSLGFAAILLGLAVDFGLVLHQEKQAHPHLAASEARRMVAPGILWSATTTAIAFALLNFGGLPGLAQLGTLVATGVLVAAAIMLGLFLRASGANEQAIPADPHRAKNSFLERSAWSTGVLFVSLLLPGLAALILVVRPPVIDASSKPLRPERSEAYDAMDEFEHEIGTDDGGWAVIIGGANEQDVADELLRVRHELERGRDEGTVGRFELPDALWANPSHQTENRPVLASIIERRDSINAQMQGAGFTTNSTGLANAVFDGWEAALKLNGTYWPSNDLSRWVMRQVTSRQPGHLFAAGHMRHPPGSDSSELVTRVQNDHVWFAGWDRLGPTLLAEVETRLQLVLGLICASVGLILFLTFRSVREVLLSTGVLAFSGVLLLAIMSALGWEWNLMNLMAVPLLLGGTVDYTIHMQLSLRRNQGAVADTFRSTGKAVLLCAATTAVGFGSLGFSNNAGLASLGKVCAMGAVCSALTACFLLPAWWTRATRPGRKTTGSSRSPSRLYRATGWRIIKGLSAVLPLQWSRRLAANLAALYSLVVRDRFEVVVANLRPLAPELREGTLPSVDGKQAVGEMAGRLFRNFGHKIADLLHFENGGAVDALFVPTTRSITPDEIRSAQGTLLLTVHLGNWEFGAPMLQRLGIPLKVLTLDEPGDGFTQLRQQARARRGIETIVIGGDAFAFVEVLKQLQEGAVIALLLDRPPASGAVEVELFGRSFRASNAAAELARASGCRLLPVAVPWTPRGYEIQAMPEIKYDRARLGDREARRRLTGEIMRAFEPVIRQHADQWFHFVPIWPESSPPSSSPPPAD